MGCEMKIQGNINCDKCTLRKSMRKNGQGYSCITLDKALRGHRNITKTAKNAWTGYEARDVIICDRGIKIPVI